LIDAPGLIAVVAVTGVLCAEFDFGGCGCNGEFGVLCCVSVDFGGIVVGVGFDVDGASAHSASGLYSTAVPTMGATDSWTHANNTTAAAMKKASICCVLHSTRRSHGYESFSNCVVYKY